MTDKKYEELLKCAAALLKDVEEVEYEIKHWDSYKALKAYLPPPPPSREEIASYLEKAKKHITHLSYGTHEAAQCEDFMEYLTHAIEELRKEQ